MENTTENASGKVMREKKPRTQFSFAGVKVKAGYNKEGNITITRPTFERIIRRDVDIKCHVGPHLDWIGIQKMLDNRVTGPIFLDKQTNTIFFKPNTNCSVIEVSERPVIAEPTITDKPKVTEPPAIEHLR